MRDTTHARKRVAAVTDLVAETRVDRAVRLALNLAATRQLLGRAEAAIERVLDLHAADIIHERCDDNGCTRAHSRNDDGARIHLDSVTAKLCRHCSTSDLVPHPCATVRALNPPE